MAAGLHFVSKKRRGKPVIWYVYAWRGGPQIARIEGGPMPATTAALTDLAAKSRKGAPAAGTTIASLIEAFKAPETAEWKRLAASTKANYSTWLDRIREEFGTASLRMFENRAMRGEALEWRDRWSDQPRSADEAVKVFHRLLSWGVDRGRLAVNILSDIEHLYEFDRSDIIWETRHFDAFLPAASVEVQEAVELAACTGLRRGDLVKVPWAAIGEHAIVWKTSKSRGRKLVVIPLLTETKAILARIKARHATEMAALPERKRRPLSDTILSNSRWQPWTASGFGSRFNDAKQASGIEVNLHDLRGTFATRCMIAGLTDQEIANILGWDTKEVAAIRIKYVDQARVVVAIGARIAAASVNRL